MRRLPDGPKNRNFLRTLNWIVHPTEVLEARLQKYGDTFRVAGRKPPYGIYFSSPEALQAIFTADSDQLSSAEGNRILLPILGDHSLIVMEGEYHQRQRRLLMPPFHGDRMRAYGELICSITEQVMNQWRPRTPFAVRATMQEISLRVIIKAVFGVHAEAQYQQLQHLLGSMLDAVSSPLSSFLLFFPVLQRDLGAWSPWGYFLKQRQQIDHFLYREITERRAAADSTREDILSLLLSARDEAGQLMTDAELRDELLTLLFAGHETTASALAWALYWVDALPAVRDRLLAELDSLEPGAVPTEIAQLPYLTSVCQETLRIYPIALNAFPRIVKKPMELMGYSLDPGTFLIPSIYLAHRREQVYPNPHQFRPERFLERQFSPYEYLPFGGGNRRCIGLAFAQFEMKLVLATILSRWQIARVGKGSVKPARRGLTVAPPASLQMMITENRQTTAPIHSVQLVKR
ncbi:MAG: cytochrome P450 [Cyanothece sp. SIO1E1]|nr:cytochrome P450 [Cyanothece sp. SIO1E1]